MKDNEVGRRLREQIGKFSGIFLPRFSKPQGHFIEQMLYGMQAAQDVKLSNIGRALGEKIALKKTEERLSHHLAAPGMGQEINAAVVSQAADRVKEDTLIVIDPTDICKTYARRMPYLATVRDGSTGEARDLAHGCTMLYAERLVHETDEGEKVYMLEFGFRHVRLPGRAEELTLVVVRGFGEEPMMLLTDLPVKSSRTSLWFVVRGYLGRWMVEETIRFIKQSYNLEDIRVLDYDRLKNLVALVVASAYFAAVWLGEGLRLAVLRRMVTALSRRFFGVPQFHYYALADGIRTILTRLGRWMPSADDLAPPQPQPRQLSLF